MRSTPASLPSTLLPNQESPIYAGLRIGGFRSCRRFFYARSRRYTSALEAALFADDVPVAVYDNLIATVRSHLPIVHQYYALRRQVFGSGKLNYYDTFIRIAPEICVHHRFNEAIDFICAALAPLGEEYVHELRNGLNARWVDRYETQGKRTGSFSSSSYRNPPFILMNYRTDTISSVFSVATHGPAHPTALSTGLVYRSQAGIQLSIRNLEVSAPKEV